MTLSRRQKKLLHALTVAFTIGALGALQMVAWPTLTTRKALALAALSVLGGGLARVAGALIESIKTTDPIGAEPE